MEFSIAEQYFPRSAKISWCREIHPDHIFLIHFVVPPTTLSWVLLLFDLFFGREGGVGIPVFAGYP